jgi:aconitate hydratase 2/2-methylisocitrate dehydratase
VAAAALKKTLLMFDQFHDVKEKADKGNAHAKAVLQSWADAEWFTSRPEVPKKHHRQRLQGGRRDQHRRPVARARRLEPPRHPAARAGHAQERPPRHHARADGKRGPVKFIEDLRAKGNLVAYVGDVVGTGSSRKSATNSVLWFTGEDIPFVPNKRFGGVCLGGKIAPIFYNTMEDSGALPIELDVSQMNMGDVVELRPTRARRKGRQGHCRVQAQERRAVRRSARRWPHSLIIGRGLTAKAREAWAAAQHAVPPAAEPGRHQGRLHAGAEDGRARLSACRRAGRAPRHLLRAPHDLGRAAGHHRPDDARRTQGPGLPGLQRRPGDAVVLPHGRVPEAGGRQDAP